MRNTPEPLVKISQDKYSSQTPYEKEKNMILRSTTTVVKSIKAVTRNQWRMGRELGIPTQLLARRRMAESEASKRC